MFRCCRKKPSSRRSSKKPEVSESSDNLPPPQISDIRNVQQNANVNNNCSESSESTSNHSEPEMRKEEPNREDQTPENEPEVEEQEESVDGSKPEVDQEGNEEEQEVDDDLLYVFGCLCKPEMTLRDPRMTEESMAKVVLRLHPLGKKWIRETHMSWGPELFSSAVIGTKVYISGGHNDVYVLDRLDCYDTQTRKWTQLAPMAQPRMRHAMAALGGYLYVTGGSDIEGVDVYDSVERYSPETNTWESLPAMGTPRFTHELIVHAGSLMALGGTGPAVEPVDTTELYSPGSESWVPGPKMVCSYAAFGAASVGDKVYVTGGKNSEVLADRFRRMWRRPRGYVDRASYGAQLAVLNGRLVAVGGETLGPSAGESINPISSEMIDSVFGGDLPIISREMLQMMFREAMGVEDDWQAVKFIEEFDEKTEVWTKKYPMWIAHRGHGIAIVKNPRTPNDPKAA